MSWYQEKVNSLIEGLPSDSARFDSPSRQYTAGKEVPVTITITDMHTEADREKISSALLSLNGVSGVRALAPQKRITVTLDMRKISLDTIAYTIAKLGYHYIQRG